MEMPAFHFWYEIEKIQRNQAKVLECANATAKAYAEEIGHPEGYQPFTVDDPAYHLNTGGLQTVISVLPILALYRGIHFEEMDRAVPALLKMLANMHLSDDPEHALHDLYAHIEPTIAAIVANAFWNHNQDWQDQVERHNNFPLLVNRELFQRIPLARGEIAKDFTQVRVAAAWLCDQLGIEWDHPGVNTSK
jgi:hypothetical protein